MSSDETSFPARYSDLEYQETHRNLFSSALLQPLQEVLPPGVSKTSFEDAINEIRDVVGNNQVILGKGLEEYVDPYELWEHEGKRKMPSCAIW
jgi:hypothetical protein